MLAVLGGAIALAKSKSDTSIHPRNFPNSNIAGGYDNQTAFLAKQRGYNPGILNDTENERMLHVQKYTNVRAPYGPPNPHQHQVNDMSGVIGRPEYQILYQKNIKNLTLHTRNWRIDPVYNSPYNNYSSFHQSEPCIHHISNYWNKQNERKNGPDSDIAGESH